MYILLNFAISPCTAYLNNPSSLFQNEVVIKGRIDYNVETGHKTRHWSTYATQQDASRKLYICIDVNKDMCPSMK